MQDLQVYRFACEKSRFQSIHETDRVERSGASQQHKIPVLI